MKIFNLCLLGFGNVGRAFARLLVEKSEEMREEFGLGWRVTGLATRRAGWLAAPGGFRAWGRVTQVFRGSPHSYTGPLNG